MEPTKKLQLYVTERQYQLLKVRAGKHRSMAAVVRDLIDTSTASQALDEDPFIRLVRSEMPGSGTPYSAEQAKHDLYRQSS